MLQPIISRRRILLPFEGKVRAMWPQARHLEHQGIDWAVLQDGPREHIALAAAGYKLPAPILRHYDWEHADPPPFEIQKTTAALMSSSRRCYVLNDMGCGKTRSALWAWRYLRRQGCAGKLLVVCPLSTMRFTWGVEAFAIMPHVKAVVLHSSSGKKYRLKQLADPDAEIFIINHDGVKTIELELLMRKDIDCLVLDELAVYRNRSGRTERMKRFAERFAWVWGMTGRPMPNAPTDVWHQAKILTPTSVPKYFKWARDILMQNVGNERFPKWIAKTGAVEMAQSWMQPSVRFALDDIVELPEAISRTVDVEMGKEQNVAYVKLAREMAIAVKEKRIVAANAGVAMGKLLQVANGWVYDTEGNAVEFEENPRKELLVELIDEAPHKLLVLVPWRHSIEGLSKYLFSLEEPIDHAVIHGDVTHRETIFDAFQNTEQYRVLLAHPGTIHHGLTLTAATTVIWYSPVPSLDIYEQANARIRRVGQRHKQLFLHMQSTAIEQRVYSLLRSKQRLQDQFLELIKQQDNDNA